MATSSPKSLAGTKAAGNALFIAISGYGRVEDVRRSADAGFDHHLVKPIDHEALLALLGPSPRPPKS
jgi:CheY-like chemotaxis protein